MLVLRKGVWIVEQAGFNFDIFGSYIAYHYIILILKLFLNDGPIALDNVPFLQPKSIDIFLILHENPWCNTY